MTTYQVEIRESKYSSRHLVAEIKREGVHISTEFDESEKKLRRKVTERIRRDERFPIKYEVTVT